MGVGLWRDECGMVIRNGVGWENVTGRLELGGEKGVGWWCDGGGMWWNVVGWGC